MSSPISFGGKCATVLVGAALSWATITIPEFDQAVGRLFRIDAASTSNDMPMADVSFGELEVTAPPQVADEDTSNAEIEAKLAGLEAGPAPESVSALESVSAPESASGYRPAARLDFQAGAHDSSLMPGVSKDATQSITTSLAPKPAFSEPHTGEPLKLATGPNGSRGQRIEQITSQLKQLGASYVLLERLPQRAGDKFRARCDLAGPQNPVKCCFEAVRDSPNEALEEVLQAVWANAKRPVSPRASI